MYSAHTLGALHFQKTENNVSSTIKHQEHKRNALTKAQSNITKLETEIKDSETNIEKGVLELALMTDGPDSLKLKLSDITNPNNNNQARTNISNYIRK